MPIYEYVCQKCDRLIEVIQQIRKKPLAICPHCGGKLKKAASAPAIQFKGSGWYVTDYARAKKEGTKEEKEEKKGEKKEEKKEEKSGVAEKAISTEKAAGTKKKSSRGSGTD